MYNPHTSPGPLDDEEDCKGLALYLAIKAEATARVAMLLAAPSVGDGTAVRRGVVTSLAFLMSSGDYISTLLGVAA